MDFLLNTKKTKIGFIHNAFPVLSQTFISKEMLGLQKLGLTLEIFSLFYPDDEIVDKTYPNTEEIKYVVSGLNPAKIVLSTSNNDKAMKILITDR